MSVVEAAFRWRYARQLYLLKSGRVKTPPMIPVSMPNSVPEKQAYMGAAVGQPIEF